MTGQDETVFVDVPTELGPYRLVRILGRGGMGEVWQAFDTNLERDVAVKLMRRELLANEEAVRRFGREARAVARLNHPNIVQVYAFGDEKGILYFIMELVEGETVGDVIKRQGSIPLEQSTSILLQAIEGLSYASVRGIVHRDIKPSNLMLTPDGRVKIADFGLARMMEQDSQVTAAGSTMGSPNYMSPEQARGEEADHRSDIYSLGITFYQMLTGQLPFTAQTPLSVLLMQIQNPLPEPQFLKELADGRALTIIKRMTQKKAADRYQTYGELAADVARLAPTVRIGHSAYAGTMSMPTPGVVSADLLSPSGSVAASAAGPPSDAPTAVVGGPAGTGSIVTAVGSLPARSSSSSDSSATISESDLGITAPGSLKPAGVGEPGMTPPLPPQGSGGRRSSRAVAFGLGGVSVLGATVLALYLSGPPAKSESDRDAGQEPPARQSVAEQEAASPSDPRVSTVSEPATSGIMTAAATPAASPVLSPVSSEPVPSPVPGMSPAAQPTPTVVYVPVIATQVPAGQGIVAGTPVYMPTPDLYAANVPVIPSPTPTPRPTPPPYVARYAELAPEQSPNTPVQIYDAQGQPAFELPARTRVEYLEAATIAGRAMVQIGYEGRRGYALLEQISPLYTQGTSDAAVPAETPARTLPRQIMAGRPGGTGTIDIFANERLGGRPLHSVTPGTILDVLDETPQTWVVRLPNGRRGHVLKSLSSQVDSPGQ